MPAALPSLETLIRRLVAIPSVSSVRPELDQVNAPVCELLAGWLEHLGFRTELKPVPGMAGKFNLLARIGSGEDGLVLSGHTDTVPFDADRWSVDPFAGTVRDGRLYGLGSADMKSFLAVAALAAERLPLARLRRPLVIVATADEESGMAGARALVAEGERPGARVLIGEPTGLRPVTRHKGLFMEEIRIEGRSGHGSDPAAGLNAIDGMVEVIDALHRYRVALEARCRDDSLPVPGPTLNLGRIRGGDNPNRICGACELSVDVRLPAGIGVDAARALLRTAVRERLAGSGYGVCFTELFAGIEPLAPGAEHALSAACEEASGHACGAVAFGTEGPLYRQLGMEVVVCGPGDIAVAHQPDESIALADAARAVDMVAGLVHRFCLERP